MSSQPLMFTKSIQRKSHLTNKFPNLIKIIKLKESKKPKGCYLWQRNKSNAVQQKQKMQRQQEIKRIYELSSNSDVFQEQYFYPHTIRKNTFFVQSPIHNKSKKQQKNKDDGLKNSMFQSSKDRILNQYKTQIKHINIPFVSFRNSRKRFNNEITIHNFKKRHNRFKTQYPKDDSQNCQYYQQFRTKDIRGTSQSQQLTIKFKSQGKHKVFADDFRKINRKKGFQLGKDSLQKIQPWAREVCYDQI